jgi:transcriptional regulator with XRE-family HTH domain
MSREKVKNVEAWAEKAKALRLSRPGSPSQEKWARILGISVGEVRRWEQGIRPPGVARCIELGKLAGEPDCWYWWALAGLPFVDSNRVIDGIFSRVEEQFRGRRFSEETVVAAHAALNAIIDHAPSGVVEKVMADLQKFAGRFGEKKS